MSINLTQRFLYETDSLTSFETVLDTMVKLMYEEDPTEYSQMFVTKRSASFSDGKRWIGPKGMASIDPRGWSKPDYMHVCSIGDYKSDIKEGDEAFSSYVNLVQTVIHHLKHADIDKFFRECGDGYDDMFNEYDGGIGAGYRLTQRPSGGWNHLDISLCHIYYGK
jgi:hypothetical protein